ncbi:DNA ligase/mRNA capping enzyme, partial [Punctularia strigosozonata HHB-11173 SS5]|uniref:DNA ligase/mRNA capping enzyme n=1 Tax=Punctularia strigosozonata (strain HHB-11173) TaxID=741275 RepID=UPI00044163B2
RWVADLNRRFHPLPKGTTAAVFKLLFPEDDARRKYDLQETRLARHLVTILGVSDQPGGRGARLRAWNASNASGCLGEEVKRVLDPASPDIDGRIWAVSIAEVDALLDELATTSAWSADCVRTAHSPSPRRTRSAILSDLFRDIPALDAAFLTQIILKDLRPLLYPLPETHTTVALRDYKSNALSILTREIAMKVWDPSGRMLKIYASRANLEEAAHAFDEGDLACTPVFGLPIQIPKSVKGTSCRHALQQLFRSSIAPKKIWAEVKYDGERAQIHVQRRILPSVHQSESLEWEIKIFSKSMRDSTRDRIALHPIILEALGIGSGSSPRFKDNIILDAEIVAYSDVLGGIDEFWRIRSLISSTADNVRGQRSFGRSTVVQDEASQCSLISNASDGGNRHLALVFFDVLMIDSVFLLQRSYAERRATLEDIVIVRQGHSMLAGRECIHVSDKAKGRPCEAEGEQLASIFARAIAAHQEGLVLKADNGAYNSWSSPWVKLKKDYIPGYGDCVDLVIVGAGWDKDRARELRVAPETFTTFYVGAVSNTVGCQRNSDVLPHFEVFFTVSYGLSREQLEELNFLIKSSDPVMYQADLSKHSHPRLTYTLTMFSGLVKPNVLLRVPLLVELYGAGFTKAPSSKFYELRFPRLTKFYRTSERSASECLTLQELNKIAHESVGRDRSLKDIDDWCKKTWNKTASPSVRCPKRKKASEQAWEEKFALAD